MPPVVFLDVEDDYKSDECDEQTASELYFSAFFNDTKPSPIFDPKIQPQEIEKIEVVSVGCSEIETLRVSRELMEEGIATKIGPSRSKGSEDDGPFPGTFQSPSSDSDSDDDINAVTKPGGKKVVEKEKIVVEVVKTCKKTKILKILQDKEDEEEVGESVGTDSHFASSVDEFSLSSEDEDMAINVTQYHRGKPDKVVLTKESTTVEERERLWRVDIEDRYKHINKGKRYHSNIDCRNCRKMGHSVNQCTEPRNIVCFLCGENTHAAWSCPNKMCYTCKRSGHHPSRCHQQDALLNIQCRLCSKFGHTIDVCPDHWRRFHLTTTEGPPKEPETTATVKKNRRFCSWCGRKGHYSSECREAEYSAVPSRLVHSYVETDYSSSKNVAYITHTIENSGRKRQTPAPQREAVKKPRKSQSIEFLPLAGTSSSWVDPPFESRIARFKNSDLQHVKKSKKLSAFANAVFKRADSRKRSTGIESMPSVKCAKRKTQNGDGGSKLNRRKERRKIQRMEQRSERDKKRKRKTI